MKPYRLFLILFLIIVSFGTISRFTSTKTRENIPRPGTGDFFPQAVFTRPAATDFPCYQVFDKDHNLIGYYFFTSDIVTGVSGYAGPIHLVVVIDPNGKIITAQILQHHETPGLTSSLPDFMQQLIGKNIESPLTLSDDIDGISGATITSRAVLETINQAATKVLPSLLSRKIQNESINRTRILKPDKLLLIPALTLIFILAVVGCLKKNPILRWLTLSSGFIIIGLITGNMLSLMHVAGTVLGQLPALTSQPDLYLLLFGAFITAFLLGRIYCSGICPFAFVEELLFHINKKLFKRTASPNLKTDTICRWIKYVSLILILSSSLWFAHSGLGAIEVYLTVFNGTRSIGAWLLAAAVMGASFFYQRFWCKYLCPFGAVLALFSQFKILKKRSSSSYPCTDCAECFYCDHCHSDSVLKSNRIQNNFFILATGFSVILLIFVVANSIYSITGKTPVRKTIVNEDTKAYSNIQDVLKKLEEEGITPSPAKYWRTVDHEEND
ncbi:MAG: FMN-binding protein [Candidatus Omnitrophota bacterium]